MKGTALPAGMVLPSLVRDEYTLMQMRQMPLKGGTILISDYPELVQNLYVGDTENSRQVDGKYVWPWLYRCSDAAGNNRSISGLYFMLPDPQGLALRFAGTNSHLEAKMADGQPYNGGAAGEFMEDALQQHWHIGLYIGNNPPSAWYAGGSGGGTAIQEKGLSSGGSSNYFIGNVANPQNKTVRVAEETRMATIGLIPTVTF
jgi:hypothetical protein